MADKLSYHKLIKMISENKSALICGNGFSINFDDRYKCWNLMNSLYTAHQYVLTHYEYKIKANKNFKDVFDTNFNGARKEMKHLDSKEKFIAFFDDAVKFIRTIIDNPCVLKWVEESKIDNMLTFGLRCTDLLRNISNQYKNNPLNVNYEYWTIVIYFVLSMKSAPADLYVLDTENVFIKAVLAGAQLSIDKPKSEKTAEEYTVVNGVFIYFRFLFSVNILLNGDSVNVERLEKWSSFDINSINEFLSYFDSLMTTNYDMILENISHRNIGHLHGYYAKKSTTVWSQSLSVNYGLTKYDLSTIIIGDYFISKSIYGNIVNISKSQIQNTKTKTYDEIIKENTKNKEANNVIIFGLNVDNDYHIIRSIQINLANLDNPQIVYCYYSDEDRKSFENIYNLCITYSEDLKEAVRNIKLVYVDSKEIVRKIFKQK